MFLFYDEFSRSTISDALITSITKDCGNLKIILNELLFR